MPAGAEPAAGPRSALCLVSPLVCHSPVFLLCTPPPRPLHLRGGKYILMPLGGRSSQGFDGLAAAAFRGAGESLRRLGWPGRAPPAAQGFKCPSLRASPSRGARASGWTPFLRDLSSRGRPRIKGGEPGPWQLALTPYWGTAAYSGLPPAELGLHRGVGRGSGSVRAATGWALAAGGGRSARRRGFASAPASLPARPPGSRARPRTLFLFSGLFVPLSVFCHPPKRRNQTKESLYFFSGLVK
ncbi:uncharacterized protein LOC129633030 [Bubalus kerabau]|uniref:uncharacterized protein LOC129633030 n=1 Tax=Bubalus carabanensis TaxID=3119969 RepID=UPI00244EAC9A|nr:uncharacterized protein LOC129633030 [Bubalus carabanensis]